MHRFMERRDILLIFRTIFLSVCVLCISCGPADAQKEASIDAVSWSPSGDRLAIGYIDGTVQIWNVGLEQISYTLQGHTDSIVGLSWKPDGSQLISGSWDGTARVWDTITGALLATLPSPTVTGGGNLVSRWEQDHYLWI